MKHNSSGRLRGVDDKYVLTESAEHGLAVAKTSLQDSVNLDIPSLTTKSVPNVVDSTVVLRADGSYGRVSVATLLNVPALTCRLDVYTDILQTGEWTKPAGAAWVYLYQIAAGGGGGSGRKAGTGVDVTGSGGGGGGGGGGFDFFMVPASLLPSRLQCRISVGGSGNPSQLDSGDGYAGNGATAAQIGVLNSGYIITTNGGSAGNGGTNTGGGGGAGGVGLRFSGGAGGVGNEAGSGAAGVFPGGGGGGGGWENSLDYNGGNGARGWGSNNVGTAGTKGNMTGDATDAQDAPGGLTAYNGLGAAGGGGGGGTGAYVLDPGYNAGDGGAGAYPGGGGGGGGAATYSRGNNSGYGGQGANGLSFIATFF